MERSSEISINTTRRVTSETSTNNFVEEPAKNASQIHLLYTNILTITMLAPILKHILRNFARF